MSLIKNKGIGLLEIMLVIIIIMSVALMSTRYYITTREAARVAAGIDMTNTIVNAAYQWVTANNGNFNGISMEILASESYQSYGDGSGKNPWHGDIIIAADSSGNLQFTMNNLPLKACGNMLEAVKKTSQDVRNNCTDDILTVYFTAP